MKVTFKYKDGQFCVAEEALAVRGIVRLPGDGDYLVLEGSKPNLRATKVGRPVAIDDDVFVATPA